MYGLSAACSWHACVFSSPVKTLLVQDPQWAAPRLLQLPDNYNIIFQYYHRKACTACKKVPKDPALCLVCGAFVCLKGACCKQQGTCECVLVSLLERSTTQDVWWHHLIAPGWICTAVLELLLWLAALPALRRSYRHLPTDKCLSHHHYPWTSFLPLGFCLPWCPRRGGPWFTVHHTVQTFEHSLAVSWFHSTDLTYTSYTYTSCPVSR